MEFENKRENLEKLKVVQLKSILKKEKLKISGKKDELIDRILEHRSEKEEQKEKYPIKQEKKSTNVLPNVLPTILTGVREGEYLVGIGKQSKNGVIKICKGTVPPLKDELDELRADKNSWGMFVQKLGSVSFFSGMNLGEREKWLSENESEKDIYIDEMENGVIEVLDLGNSDMNNLNKKDKEKLFLEGPTEVKDLRKMFPFKPGSKGLKGRATLMFRRWIWGVANYDSIVDSFEGKVINTETGEVYNSFENEDEDRQIHKIEGLGYDRNVSVGILTIKQDSSHSIDEITMNAILELMKNRKIESYKNFQSCRLPPFKKSKVDSSHLTLSISNQVKRIEKGLTGFTPGGLKSLLQKIVRFGSVWVEFGPILKFEHYPSDLVLLVSLRMLMMNPGSFVPDIQRFVSGMESALKRLVVTLCEDAIISPENVSVALGVMSGAFLAQRVKSWKPDEKLVMNAFRLALEGYNSSIVFDYDIGDGLKYSYPMERADDEIKLISFLLDEMKSFETDLGMVRSIAKHFPSIGVQSKYRPLSMPLEHSIDQHWAPELVFFYPREFIEQNKGVGSKPFSPMMKRIFGEVTGINSRRFSGRKGRVMNIREYDEYFETREFVKLTRLAQYSMLMSKQSNRRVVSEPTKSIFEFKYTLERGWIAGMVGAMEIKLPPAVMVTLNPNEIEELMVMRKPSRDMKDGKLNEEEKNMGINVAMSILKKGKKYKNETLIRREDKYYVNGVEWDDYRRDITVEMNVMRCDPLSEDWMIKTLHHHWIEKGVVEHLEEQIYDLLERERKEDIRRLITYMDGSEVKINGISRDGGGKKYGVVIEDSGAFQILLKLAYLAPGVVERVKGSLKFEVHVQHMFVEIREWITKYLIKNSDFVEDGKWDKFVDMGERNLWDHQIRSIEEMKEAHSKGRGGHFLHVTTGFGKTLITLSYLKYLQENGELPSYVIYSIPPSALNSIAEEISIFGLKHQLLIPIKKVDQKLHEEHDVIHGKVPNPYVITIIQHDHLRYVKEEFSPIMTDAIFVFDEVHMALNETLRTTHALHLANLSREFVALTGTPIIDNHIYKLIWWLKKVVPFDVNVNTFWVAINGMISKIVRTDVVVSRKSRIVELDPEGMTEYKRLVPPSLGGCNSNPGPKDFIRAMNICYENCTMEMVRAAVKYIDFGVFIVAKDNKHQKMIFDLLVEENVNKEDIFMIEKNSSLVLNDRLVEEGKKDYKIVITTVRRSAGYTLSRLRIMITSVYPSNNAVRTQLEGRINRIDQHARKIWYYTVHTGILTNILEHHRDAHNLMAVLRALADEIKLKE